MSGYAEGEAEGWHVARTVRHRLLFTLASRAWYLARRAAHAPPAYAAQRRIAVIHDHRRPECRRVAGEAAARWRVGPGSGRCWSAREAGPVRRGSLNLGERLYESFTGFVVRSFYLPPYYYLPNESARAAGRDIARAVVGYGSIPCLRTVH